MTKALTALALTGAALLGLVGAAAPAAAHGHHHAHFYLGAAPYVYVYPSYGYVSPSYSYVYSRSYECSYEKAMWLDTGSRYWKARYFECRGW